MEFRRAYWDEKPNDYLVDRHYQEIFPLLHRRFLFSGVDNFLLYDFFTPHGEVNEDVFAYSNGLGNVRTLVIYHNKYGETNGWVRSSVGFLDKTSRKVIQRSLKEGLNISGKENHYVIFRDHSHNLEYIRPSKELAEKGLYIHLEAYKYHVFIDFREIADDTFGSYQRLYEYLGGRGVPNIEEALKELLLQPIQNPFSQIANTGYFGFLNSIRIQKNGQQLPEHVSSECSQKVYSLIYGIESLQGVLSNKETVVKEIQNKLENILWLNFPENRCPQPVGRNIQKFLKFIKSGLDQEEHWLSLYGWLFTHNLGKLSAGEGFEELSESWLDEWQLGGILARVYQQTGLPEDKAWQCISTVKTLILLQNWYQDDNGKTIQNTMHNWLGNSTIQQFLKINRYQDILWFNKEAFDDLLWWLAILAFLEVSSREGVTATAVYESLMGINQIIGKIKKLETKSGYQVQKLLGQ